MIATARSYLKSIESLAQNGDASEMTYRHLLKGLMEALTSGIEARHETRGGTYGRPDFKVLNSTQSTIGFIETKDLADPLDLIEESEQLIRYRSSIDNLLLTNYLDFYWYSKGKREKTFSLGVLQGSSIRPVGKDGLQEALAYLVQFSQHSPEQIGSPEQLARHMARLTRLIRDILAMQLKDNVTSRHVKQIYDSIGLMIDHHMGIRQFADMFAQSIAYGLFVAKVSNTSGKLRLQDVARNIPNTNPFLQQFFHFMSAPQFDSEVFAFEVEELVELFNNADMNSILADFGKRAPQHDPMIHFYETFLAAHDPDEREKRGVYYTPASVVSYMVRSVDQVLRANFGCSDGIADKSKIKPGNKSHRVLILDPGCGTGSFLYAIIDHIRNMHADAGNMGEWSSYVKHHLIPRLHGFEVLMAPYAIAHLKINLELQAYDMEPQQRLNWAYDVKTSDRLRIYLTNTLDDGLTTYGVGLGSGLIYDEVNAASEIKRESPIMVVIGNPPYSGHSANKSDTIKRLINDYKFVDGLPLGEKNPKWLQDDYVKFIRFGQLKIEQNKQGILAFITNHAWLDNPTFRGMRRNLMKTFDEIYVLNLHGNAKKKENALDGSKDENVFDIQQGVAISLFIKHPDPTPNPSDAVIHFADQYGKRGSKEQFLFSNDVSTTQWQTLSPSAPYYLFIPQDVTLRDEYEKGLKINETFPVHSVGIVTARDGLTIAITNELLEERITEFLKLNPEEAREKFNLGKDSSDWKVESAQKELRNLHGGWKKHIVPILYRPFDIRWTVYCGKASGFHARPRPEVMKHLLGKENIALTFTRSISIGKPFEHVFVVQSGMLGRFYPDASCITYFAPMFLENGELNVHSKIAQNYKDQFPFYFYALSYSKDYRKRYIEFLRNDFPRIPLTSDQALFNHLSDLGKQLMDLHLLRFDLDMFESVKYPVPGTWKIESGYPKFLPPGHADPSGKGKLFNGRVYINRQGGTREEPQYIDGIPPEVWGFHIGGYQVLDHWLKARRGRKLSDDDRIHLRKVNHAIARTIRIMTEIDDAIPCWPLP